MKFKRLDIKVRGESLYIEAESKMPASIEADIKEGLILLESQKTKDSVPPQFRPKGNDTDLFNQFFGK